MVKPIQMRMQDYEIAEKIAVHSGNNSRTYVPKSWIGKKSKSGTHWMNEIEKLKERIQELEDALKEAIVEKGKIEKEFEEFKAKHSHTVSELQKALKIKADKQTASKPLGLRKLLRAKAPQHLLTTTYIENCSCKFC